MASMDKVKVAVRVRPFNRREIELGTRCIVDMDDAQTMLYNPMMGVKESAADGTPVSTSKSIPKTFAFDHCFWSMTDDNPKYSSQEKVFNCLGTDVLERAFEGYNACIFAYGQTGSGKSYSMMGTSEQKGIIPRLCDALFERIETNNDPETSFKVEVSYMEIYNERVRDLLDPQGKHNLKVREHNILGPYVDDLSTLAVSSFEDIDNLMYEGNKSRTVASTNMNSESSRSHAVFNIILTQTLTDTQSAVSGEKVSKISLVDLAGSERAQKTGAVGERLKEGSNINKSLTTLGLVISALADQASGKNKGKFVPYRDSVLTWLLKDNLGGNSKTVMVATLSPSADNYEETLSTLRYADRAKRIVNHAVVNEDPNARIIRELREEVDMLKKMLDEAQSMKADGLRERLEESEKLMNEMGKTWEEKLQETERIHQERHAALEKMGISVQTSGIKVEQSRFYLVNLNADPSLNELLVYYLKSRTLVGRPDASTTQDIQLLGLGIMSEHCVIEIDGTDVYIIPLDGARTCVNGRSLAERTKVKHGDRIVWGNNHFFRINCPKANSPSSDVPETIDYDFAQQELMLQQMGNDPIQEAISHIEKQHEEAKQEALDKQRQMYERQMQLLRSQLMSPSTPSIPYPFESFAKMTPTGNGPSTLHPKYQQWARDREKFFHQSLTKLKEEVVKANALVREAKFLAQELSKDVDFSVTLQIPAANLSPNRKKGAFVSEPAIVVKQKDRINQVWSMEKFENKVFEMRDIYDEFKEKLMSAAEDALVLKREPFSETQENHNLIGVANIFLEVLLYDAKLEYHVPIISQQGEVAGRLHIELSRVPSKPTERPAEEGSASETASEQVATPMCGSRHNGLPGDEESSLSVGSSMTCRLVIKEARGLPHALSNFVFCQYTFWSHPDLIVVPPIVECEGSGQTQSVFTFNHSKEFVVNVTDEFLEHCGEGALSIEVWGHRSTGFTSLAEWHLHQSNSKSRSILDRWSELIRKIELWLEIHEMNDVGEFMPVEVSTKNTDVPTGGVYQLRQGHSRRILVQVKPVHNSGTLPIICESINHVSIGCVTVRSKLQKGLDSYQEEDLSRLRDKWSEALVKRREYLDEQLQKIMNKEVKSDEDVERERSLIDQWVCLTEESNELLVPAAGSAIPGAPADWDQPRGMERHIPVIFLDLNAEDMSTPNAKEGMQMAAGVNSLLPKEHGAKFFTLPLVKNLENDVAVLLSWDSSVHDSAHLNRVTPNTERIYMILKVVVQLSHPASMEVVLRKRISVNIYKRQSVTDKLKRRITKGEFLSASGVTYEIVSNIPKASEDLEDRESLARIAASQNDQGPSDGESYIEKYIKGVSAVESILTLDRLRQDVAVKEILAARGRPLRKATSVPNIHNVTSPPGFVDQIRSDSSQDLGAQSREAGGTLPKHLSDSFHVRSVNRTSESSSSLRDDKDSTPFGIAPVGGKVGISPAQSSKLIKPMTTVVEEQTCRHTDNQQSKDSGADSDDNCTNVKRDDAKALGTSPSGSSEDCLDTQTFHTSAEGGGVEGFLEGDKKVSASGGATQHSPVQQSKTFTPSVASSGYASQALSSLTLSSEDSVSCQSVEEHSGEAAGELNEDEGVNEEGNPALTDSDSQETVMVASVTSDSAMSLCNADQFGRGSVPAVSSPEQEGIRETAGGESGAVSGMSESLLNSDETYGASLANQSDQAIDRLIPRLNSSDEASEYMSYELPEVELTSQPNAAQNDSCYTGECLLDKEPCYEAVNKEEKPNIGLQESGSEKLSAAPMADHATFTLPECSNSLDANSSNDDKCSTGADQSEQPVGLKSGNVDSNSSAGQSELGISSSDLENTANQGSNSQSFKLQHNCKPNEQSGVISSETVLSRSTGSDKQEASADNALENSNYHNTSTTNITASDTTRGANTTESVNTVDGEERGHTPDLLKSAVCIPSDGSQQLKLRGGERGGARSGPVRPGYRPASMMIEGTIEEMSQSVTGSNEETGSLCSLTSAGTGANTSSSGGGAKGEEFGSISSFGSHADLHRIHDNSPLPEWIKIGEPVTVLFTQGGSRPGVIQFIGQTEFASGNWVGVELETTDGKNDGSVKGVRYFRCRPHHGVFVRHDKLLQDRKRRGSARVIGAKLPSSARRSMGNLAATAHHSQSSGATSSSSSFMKPTAASSARHK